MKKCSSVVWQFFDRLEENNRCVAVLCKLCECEYKYFGNTTNLRAHLMKKHPIQWELRQLNEDGQKADESITFVNTSNITSPSMSTKRRKNKDPKDINDDVEKPEEDDDEMDTTNELIQQMRNQVSDEEWLDEDYQQVNMYRNKRKKIKREVISPPRRRPSSLLYCNPMKTDKLDHIVLDDSSAKDEYSVFGEYIANKLRKFKSPRTQGNIQQMITTILWQAEYGMYDDANTVKRVLMGPVQPTLEETVILMPDANNMPDDIDNQTKNQHAKLDKIDSV